MRVIREPALRLTGLHSHIGSQIFDTAGFEAAAHRVVGLLGQIHQATGELLGELNLGGGFGIAYTSADTPSAPMPVSNDPISVYSTVVRGPSCAHRSASHPDDPPSRTHASSRR